MIYLSPSILVVFSYLLGVYFAHQGMRNVIDRPLLYSNELILITLTVLFGWIPLVIGIYLALREASLFFAFLLIIIRFLLLPTLFNDKIESFMNKKGF